MDDDSVLNNRTTQCSPYAQRRRTLIKYKTCCLLNTVLIANLVLIVL